MSPIVRPLVLESDHNVRATFDSNPQNDRSESALAVNPTNQQNMVGASKRFTDPPNYKFALATVVTFDHGEHWVDSAPLQMLPGWAGTSDPTLAFDALGTVYLVALPFGPSTNPLGIAVYASTDGGMTWGLPTVIHSSSGDDKQNAASDRHPLSPFYGRVYAAWDDGSTLRFARTSDGVNWSGVGTNGPGAGLDNVQDSFSPAIAVTPSGDVFVVWKAGSSLKFVKSTDGGESFSLPQVLASGITPLGPPLAAPDGFPELPGGTFRVETIPAA